MTDTSRKIAIERVDHIGIRVRDLDRALGFYRVLGADGRSPHLATRLGAAGRLDPGDDRGPETISR